MTLLLKKSDTTRNPINWDEVREYWLKKKLSGETYCYRDVAKEFAVALATVQVHAATFNWVDQLAVEMHRVNSEGVRRVTKRLVVDIEEVRLRHAEVARLAADKALAKLKTLKPEDIPVKEMIALLKLGLTEERKALGIPDQHIIIPGDNPNDEVWSTKDAMGTLKKLAEMIKNPVIEGELDT